MKKKKKKQQLRHLLGRGVGLNVGMAVLINAVYLHLVVKPNYYELPIILTMTTAFLPQIKSTLNDQIKMIKMSVDWIYCLIIIYQTIIKQQPTIIEIIMYQNRLIIMKRTIIVVAVHRHHLSVH